MLIERGQQIAGLDAVVVRKLMRSMHSMALSAGRIRQEIGVGPDTPIGSLIDQLQSDGFIEVCSDQTLSSWGTAGEGSDIDYWVATVRGNALGKARMGKAMTRSKAARLLDAFLARVREANADADELFWVEKVELYGSYADPERATVGDVDLRVVLSERFADEQKQREEDLVAAAVQAGRSFSNWFDQMAWPQVRLQRRLRDGNARLDIQFESDHRPRDLPEGAVLVEVYHRLKSYQSD